MSVGIALFLADNVPRLRIHETLRNVEPMPRTQEGVELLLALLGRYGLAGEGPESLTARKIFGSGECAFRHMFFGWNGVFFANSAGAQVFVEAALAIAPADKGTASGFGKLRVVNISQFGKLSDQCGNIGVPFIVPAALADFARQISRELRLCGRIFADIMERQIAQSLAIQRRCRLFDR